MALFVESLLHHSATATHRFWQSVVWGWFDRVENHLPSAHLISTPLCVLWNTERWCEIVESLLTNFCQYVKKVFCEFESLSMCWNSSFGAWVSSLLCISRVWSLWICGYEISNAIFTPTTQGKSTKWDLNYIDFYFLIWMQKKNEMGNLTQHY
jgi:hypothetical protein